MRRRKFITLIGGAAAWPLAARAQQSTMPAVGFLNSASADGYASMAAAFRRGLKEAGYAEGQNVTIEYRWADNQYERLPALAADLVNRRVNVIFANSPSIPAALAATKTIPIIFNSGDDPVRLGFVASLNRPGGNATGVAIFAGELAAKRLELLRELIPGSKTIAVLINIDFGPSARFRADAEEAARALGVATPILQASKPSEIETAFDSLAGGNTTGTSIFAVELDGKRQDILIEALPGLRHMTALVDSINTTALPRASVSAGWKRDHATSSFLFSRSRNLKKFQPPSMRLRPRGATALNVLSSPVLYGSRQLIMQRVAELALPAIYQSS